MTLYILRHGETELNRLGIVQGSGVDADLNDTGRAQSASFFKKYKDVDFDLVVTSRLRRTHQTVHPFIQKGIPWVQTEHINEICWGQHEGQPATPERTEIYLAMIAEWQAGNFDAALPEGETARQLFDRIHLFIEWLKTRTEQHILIATHGRAIRSLVTALKGKGPAEMEDAPHANTGLYVIHYQDGSFVFETENDTSHLSETMI